MKFIMCNITVFFFLKVNCFSQRCHITWVCPGHGVKSIWTFSHFLSVMSKVLGRSRDEAIAWLSFPSSTSCLIRPWQLLEGSHFQYPMISGYILRLFLFRSSRSSLTFLDVMPQILLPSPAPTDSLKPIFTCLILCSLLSCTQANSCSPYLQSNAGSFPPLPSVLSIEGLKICSGLTRLHY